MSHFEPNPLNHSKFRVVCNNCKSMIGILNRTCPRCKLSLEENYEFNKSLFQKILDDIESGEYTLRNIATKYGYSYERIRQIYKKFTGKNYTTHREKARKEKEERIKTTVKYICSACGRKVLKPEIKGGQSLCGGCRDITYRLKRNPAIWLSCSRCGRNYHPFRNYKPKKNNYCSRSCYENRNKSL